MGVCSFMQEWLLLIVLMVGCADGEVNDLNASRDGNSERTARCELFAWSYKFFVSIS